MSKKKNKGIIFSLMMAAVVLFALSASPVLAQDGSDELTPMEKVKLEKNMGLYEATYDDDEAGDPYETGVGVHADPETFKKDYHLTFDQKEYTITEMQRVISEIIDPQMSDLEKYYVLARWVNKHVEYDWQFWSGRYNFEYYSHQWDSYGGMKEDEKSVCAGIAIFYANMCHAAGLPCKYLRLEPSYLDHTINYIPNINGHAYLVDVTEDVFLMSEHSSMAFDHLDKPFANITQDADDESFDYKAPDSDDLLSSTIKQYYDTPFDDWYKEYALHQSDEKTFGTPYEEKGSGVKGQHYASYGDCDSNRTANPGIWFLDDFYEDPAGVSAKVLAGKLDKEVACVSGVKKSYDCDTQAELEAAVENDISVRCFPSKEGGKVVAKTANLTKDTDYTLSCTAYDADAKTAQFTVTGTGEYTGTQTIDVKIKSAVVDESPVAIKGLMYDESKQVLIEPGTAAFGEMQYALGTKDEPTGAFSTSLPQAEDAGSYYVWYKAVGDAEHGESDPECLESPVILSPMPINVIVDEDDKNIKVGQSFTIKPKVDKKIPVTFMFESMCEEVATVNKNGTVTGVAEGYASIYVRAVLKNPSPNYDVSDGGFVSFFVNAGGFDVTETKVRLDKSSFVYNGKVQKPKIKTVKGEKLTEGTDYKLRWSNASSKNAGKYSVVVVGIGYYTGETDAEYTITKAKNPMSLQAKTIKIKKKKIRKKSKSFERDKAFTVSNAQGTLSYKLVSAKKGKKSFKKKFKINAKTGKLKVKKGLKKGTYKVKVNVMAGGNKNYNASAWKTVTFKVRVK